jgi:hypothetical protein
MDLDLDYEVRIAALESTIVNHENRISTLEANGWSGGGTANISEGVFTGELNVSGGNRFYDDYISGAQLGELSLSTNKALGATATVRIKGGLGGVPPYRWNFSGQPLTSNEVKMNELSLIYINESDIRIVNRIVNVPDLTAPSEPVNLTSSETTETSTLLSWGPATDNIGVVAYKIYNGEEFIEKTIFLDYLVENLTSGTEYTLGISAIDSSGNESNIVTTVVTTSSASTINSPGDLTNLHLWVDGSDKTTWTVSSNGGISTLSEKANNFSLSSNQETSASNPIPDDTDNSIIFPSIRGQLIDLVPSSVLVPVSTFHGFMIFKNELGEGNYFTNIKGSIRLAITYRSGKMIFGYYNGSSYYSRSITFTDVDNFHVFEFKNIQGSVVAYLDGQQLTDTTPDIFTSSGDRLAIGCANDNNYHKAFKLKDIFIKAGELTENERNSMLTYINQKYGL